MHFSTYVYSKWQSKSTVITALAVKKRKPLHHADCDIETKLRFLLADIPVDNVPQTRSPE